MNISLSKKHVSPKNRLSIDTQVVVPFVNYTRSPEKREPACATIVEKLSETMNAQSQLTKVTALEICPEN